MRLIANCYLLIASYPKPPPFLVVSSLAFLPLPERCQTRNHARPEQLGPVSLPGRASQLPRGRDRKLPPTIARFPAGLLVPPRTARGRCAGCSAAKAIASSGSP